MHVQDQFAMRSMEDVRRLVRSHGGALLVVAASGELQAAHVPCMLDPLHDAGGRSKELVVVGHTARADPVSAALLGRDQVLLIFQGAHGYISPAWYGEGPHLPTWNFTAVHMRGMPDVLEGDEGFWVLERSVEHFESARTEPWRLGGDAMVYARRIASETVPFRLRSANIQAKAKLSQDKERRIQDRIIAALERRGPYHNRELAAEMRFVLGRAAARGDDQPVP